MAQTVDWLETSPKTRKRVTEKDQNRSEGGDP